MGWGKNAAVLVGAYCLISPTMAAQTTGTEPQACDASSNVARALKFDGETAFAGASISESPTRDCASILLYRLMPKLEERRLTIEQRRAGVRDDRPSTGTPHFYARVHRKTGHSQETPRPFWADQKTCPALLPAIEALEIAMTPKLTGEGPARGGSIYSTIDGAQVTVWASGYVYPLNNLSHRFSVSYTTNLGTPTADWVEATLKQLAPCLSSTSTPTPDPPIP
jgi:hypothetical protein